MHRWVDGQMSKQADWQTEKMKGQLEIAYLAKFANIMPIVMVMFDLFENQ